MSCSCNCPQNDISSNVGKNPAYEAERTLMVCVRANFDSTSNGVQQLDMRAQHFRLEYTFTNWLSNLRIESRQLIMAWSRNWAFRNHQRMSTICEGSYHSNLHVVLARCIVFLSLQEQYLGENLCRPILAWTKPGCQIVLTAQLLWVEKLSERRSNARMLEGISIHGEKYKRLRICTQ